MHHQLFRWFPKSALSRMMGRLADASWSPALLGWIISCYVRFYRIDMEAFQTPPQGFPTFNAFFTRPLKPAARPIDAAPTTLVSPVDGTVSAQGEISRGRMIQAKGMDYRVADLLAGGADPEAYEGGWYLTLYLSPRDYHRIHAPCTAKVRRFAYRPGALWTVSPAGVRGVPGLFARNERLTTVLSASQGEVLLIAVGAMVVGRIKVVYHPIVSNLRSARSRDEVLARPYPLQKGEELGRFELGSTVILLFPPQTVSAEPLQVGDVLRLGQVIGRWKRQRS